MRMFVDELKRLKDKKKRNERGGKPKKLNYSENPKKEVKENINLENSKNTTNAINLNEGIIDVKRDKDPNKLIESVDAQNDKKGDSNDKDNLNQSEKINKYLNNIINYINNNNMGNESISQDIENLKKLMLSIADENMKMKGKMEEMNHNILKLNDQNLNQNQKLVKQEQKLAKQDQELTKQRQDINELKENVQFLTKECRELKEILGNIQFRDLSKNFLRSFYAFLTEEDWKKIKKNKNKKGEIIGKKIKKCYPKAEEQKMRIVQELIMNSSTIIQKGNYLAHTPTLDKYEDEIKAYKRKKKLKVLASPVTFCFLMNLGISEDLFDNAFLFLTKFFDDDLIATDEGPLLDLYFK